MFYRYIKGFEWWQIAQLMEYSESWIYELHGKSTEKIFKSIKEWSPLEF